MSKPARRYLRTLLLGMTALGVLIWAAVDQFDIPPREILDLFLASLMALAMVIGAAALVVALWQGLRWLFRGREP